MSRDCNMTIWIARDGSHNYGSASEHFMGEEGAFLTAVQRRRIGQARQLAVKSTITSPTRVDILALSVEVERES